MKDQVEVQFKNLPSDFLPLSTMSTEISVEKLCKFYHYRYNSKFVGKMERHEGYEFFYVSSGSMRITIEDTDYVLKTNDFIIIPPMKWHQMKANNVFCSSMCFLFMSSPLQEKLLTQKVSSLSKKELTILQYIGTEYIDNLTNDGYFISDLSIDMSTKRNDFAFLQALKTQIEYLLILITRDFLQKELDQLPDVNSHKKENDFIKEVLTYIHEHIAEPLSSKELASHFKYSCTYFGKIFKQATGETVTNYILKAKIQKAMLLFASDTYSVQYVSDYLNFGCVQYFSKIFKRYAGLPPIEFKQNCSQTNLMSTTFLMKDLI